MPFPSAEILKKRERHYSKPVTSFGTMKRRTLLGLLAVCSSPSGASAVPLGWVHCRDRASHHARCELAKDAVLAGPKTLLRSRSLAPRPFLCHRSRCITKLFVFCSQLIMSFLIVHLTFTLIFPLSSSYFFLCALHDIIFEKLFVCMRACVYSWECAMLSHRRRSKVGLLFVLM